MNRSKSVDDRPATCSTLEAARRLGMAVRSVQLMVDRGELQAWKTPGGHRRIHTASLERWLAARHGDAPSRPTPAAPAAAQPPAESSGPALHAGRVVLIEDSMHYQNLVTLLVRKHFPQVDLHVAHDGIDGLAMVGRLDPSVLIVDILLPGIDGATLITSLRQHPRFGACRLVVITSLDEAQRAPYAFALEGLPVLHKSRLVAELPEALAQCLAPPEEAAPPARARPS